MPCEAGIRTNRVVTSTGAGITLRWAAICSRLFRGSVSNHVPLTSTTALMMIDLSAHKEILMYPPERYDKVRPSVQLRESASFRD